MIRANLSNGTSALAAIFVVMPDPKFVLRASYIARVTAFEDYRII
jgi:hypothetical protein